MRNGSVIVISLLLSACVAVTPGVTNNTNSADTRQSSCTEELAGDTSVRLDMVQQLMEDGRLHAALAHLDELDSDSVQATYLRAEILRQSDRSDDAKLLYQVLTETCFAGQGHHGLGLIAGRQQQLAEAELQLAKAAGLLPVNARIRNDYGYALLMAGEHEGALHEFLTAIELAPGHRQAAHNLLLLLFRTGETAKAANFAQQFGIGTAEIDRLKTQAKQPLPGIALNEASAEQMGVQNVTQ